MKLKELEAILGEVEGFGKKSKIGLEQYVTPPHVAARMLHVARERGDLEDKFVCDLGAGTGALSVGAALCGASAVLSIEIDVQAAEVLVLNAENLEVKDRIHPLVGDVFQPDWLVNNDSIDVVIMNPPFGTRNKGADLAFVATALTLAPIVYSLHKTSTLPHVLAAAQRLGAKADPLAVIRYPLPRSYSFHTKANQDIQVNLIRFYKPNG